MQNSLYLRRKLLIFSILFILFSGVASFAQNAYTRADTDKSGKEHVKKADVLTLKRVPKERTQDLLTSEEKLEAENVYVKRRIAELQNALENKVREEIVNSELKKITIKKADKEYSELKELKKLEVPVIDENEIDRKVNEKLEREILLKNFGSGFFEGGQQDVLDMESGSAPSTYLLGPGDELKIIVWSEMGDETVYDVKVNPENQAYVPVIGVMGVSGLTVDQFEEMVLGKLSEKFKHFKGQVTLTKIRTIQVYVVGEVKKPGAMVISGLATAFSALYKAGGPTERGSMRNIKVLRTSGETHKIDLYNYFLSGDKSQDVSLVNGDTIFVPSFENRVKVEGMVVKPGYYEFKPGQSLGDLLKMAGNIEAGAYSGSIKILRWTGNKDRRIFDLDVANSQAVNSFKLVNGDVIIVKKGITKVGNLVSIEGAVRKPGDYSASAGLKVKDLILRAGGLIDEKVGLKYGRIYRQTTEGKEEILSFNTRWAIIGDKNHNLELKPMDKVKIFAFDELEADNQSVNIDGAVRRTGEYVFREGMRVSDLIYKARGLSLDASGEAELARVAANGISSEVKSFNVKSALANPQSEENYLLKPLDRLSILSNGDRIIEPEIIVLKGQIKRPGPYALKERGESISSLIKRAGGLTRDAFPEGAVFLRKVENIASDKQLETAENVQKEMFKQATLDLRADLLRAGAKLDDVSEVKKDAGAIQNVSQDTKNSEGIDQLVSKNENASEQTSGFGGMEMRSRDILKKMVRIPLPLAEILSGKGDKYDDIGLLEGDQITIPMIPRTVSVVGAVVNPTTIMYKSGRSVGYYVNRAGGFTEHSNHKRTVVVKSNGEVIPLRNARKIGRGDIILVPPKPKLIKPNKLQETAEIAKILGNLAVMYEVIKR